MISVGIWVQDWFLLFMTTSSVHRTNAARSGIFARLGPLVPTPYTGKENVGTCSKPLKDGVKQSAPTSHWRACRIIMEYRGLPSSVQKQGFGLDFVVPSLKNPPPKFRNY